MNQAESLEEFYTRIRVPQKGIFTSKNGHINVYDRELCKGITRYRRRDFYKISLIEEGGTVHYANKSITLDKPALVFSNPMIPYAWEPEMAQFSRTQNYTKLEYNYGWKSGQKKSAKI